MLYRELQEKLRGYDWDDGFDTPREILDDPNCDLALALEIFYLGDGYACLTGRVNESGLTEWKEFILSLYERIVHGNYSNTGVHFQIPLNRVARYKFRKQNIPSVFLDDL